MTPHRKEDDRTRARMVGHSDPNRPCSNANCCGAAPGSRRTERRNIKRGERNRMRREIYKWIALDEENDDE